MGTYARLLIVVVWGVLLIGTTSLAQASPDPQCVCASCDRPCGSGHTSSCPYGGGDGDGGGGRGGDPFNAPIFVAPVGFVGGLFMGAGWYFEEMAGNFPKTGFLDSYGNYVSIKPQEDNKAFNFGARLGGLPWLAIYLPTWPIRAGIAAIADVASRPSPKPADPCIPAYQAIASNYTALQQATRSELQKADQDIQAAEFRRTRFLDAFINDSAELRDLRQQKGAEAARAKAAGQLDVWSKSRAEKEKLILATSLSIQEKDAICRAAMDDFYKSFPGSFNDLQMGRLEEKLDVMKDSPAGLTEALKRERMVTKVLTKGKTFIEAGGKTTELWKSLSQSRENGQDAGKWMKDPATRKILLDLGIKVLPEVLDKAKVSQGVTIAGGLIDASYAATANYLYAGQIAEQLAMVEKLRTASVFSDKMANDWDRINLPGKAARERAKKLQEKVTYYERQRKESVDHAKQLCK